MPVSVEFRKLVIPDENNSPLDWLESTDPRYIAWKNDEWTFIGIQAEAIITVTQCNRATWATEYRLQSPGLWGIESDSTDDYLNEVFKEECAELRKDVETMCAGPITYQGEP